MTAATLMLLMIREALMKLSPAGDEACFAKKASREESMKNRDLWLFGLDVDACSHRHAL